ncbi:AAA family ATPase [Bacillus sp. AFS015802]|uniref:AAA family ATPase n=1 Tax=Bacillus sp. AFS015802 TaxID=2033486 RepID=UPI00211D760A|nr:AAA family ATPase [Bacillus sp. AFS015802]
MFKRDSRNQKHLSSFRSSRVGKSTTSKLLSQQVKKCVLLEGDSILDMFDFASEASWEERLRLTWESILSLTRNFIQNDFNVVIDFVVEEELDWFCHHIADLQVTLKYIVLRANKETLIERIGKRGDDDSVERSLFLLDKLESTPSNQPYLLDTTLRHPAGIIEGIIQEPRYTVKI